MTPGALRVLKELVADEDCDIAEERGVVYVGNRRTTTKIVHELLWLFAIKITFRTQGLIDDGGYTTYGINDIGRSLLRRPELEPELQHAIMRGKPFSVSNDLIKSEIVVRRSAGNRSKSGAE